MSHLPKIASVSNVLSLTRVAWAVDATAKNFDPQLKAAAVTRALWRNCSPRLEPIYVSHPRDEEIFSDELGVSWGPQDGEAMNLECLMQKQLRLPCAPPQRLQASHRTTAARVGELLHYAKLRRAQLIAVNLSPSASPWPWHRTFSERLIRKASVPVLTCHPRTEVPGIVTTLVFPTVFSRKEEILFRKVLPLAKATDTRMLLFHPLRASREQAERPALAWAEYAARQGVETKLHLSVGEATGESSLLWLTSHLRHAILVLPSEGKHSLTLARHVKCPVLLQPTPAA